MKRARPRLIRGLACVFLGTVLVLVPLGIRATFADEATATVSPRNLGIYKVPAAARDALSALHADVDHERIDGGFVARLTAAQAAALRRQGIDVELLYASEEEESRTIAGQPDFDLFHTYDQMRNDFIAAAAAHPGIARFVVLGHSVQNREIFGLRLSDNPDLEEDEPGLAFWGGIHGNEYGGAEVSCRYALYLCENYGIDADVTRYVDDNEIWCIPLINPDGNVLRTRYNANGIDLNRDLGYEWSGEGGSPSPFSQVETRVVREFCAAHSITLSTTLHTSGDYLLYPWGYAPHDVPDLAITLDLAQRYGAAASYPYVDSWDDYETHGELLDYAYGSLGTICLTIEVNNQASQIPATFTRNRAAMDLFCSLAGEGLHGTVMDAGSGLPLAAAVWISSSSIPAYSDAHDGGLHRMALPGTYNVKVWAPGYVAQSIPGVVVQAGVPGAFQVPLHPGGAECAFQVVSVNQRDPNHVYANATFPSAALGVPDTIACSLGTSGFIVLDMGEGHEILDRPGTDLRVVEALTPADPLPEAYRVYAGSAYTQSTLIGDGSGTAEFDLAASGLTSVRYLRIADISGAAPNGPLAGMDLDAVVGNIHAPTAIPVVTGHTTEPEIRLVASPNPFTSTTTLRFMTSGLAAPVELTVFDVAGRRMASLSPPALPETGNGELRLDGSDWSPGVYVCRLTCGERETTARIVRVR